MGRLQPQPNDRGGQPDGPSWAEMNEPAPCPKCKARRQYNVDGQIVHARIGQLECPAPLIDTITDDATVILIAEIYQVIG